MSQIPLTPGLTMGAASAFIPLGTIVLGLRLYQRYKQKATLATDDWLIIAAYFIVMAMQITMIIETEKHEIGYPDPDPHGGEVDAKANYPFYPLEVESIPAIGLIKLSLLFFYRRIFNKGAPKWFKWASFSLIITVIAWMIAYMFCWIFLCKPNPSAYWTSSAVEKAQCVATQKLHNSIAISDAIIDVMVVLLALPVIWALQMTLGRKLAVTGCFLLGLVTVAASIARMVVFIEVVAVRYKTNIDLEHINTLCMYWTMIETGQAFLVANIMLLYGIVASFWKVSLDSLRSLLSGSFSRSRSGKSGSSISHGEWPVDHRGNVETRVELGDLPSIHKSRTSSDTDIRDDVRYQISATTVVQQSAHR